jgi:meso-butanediol dehydrogenase / (S,S)-butanediol dehydrogenase / diacetyl reductase
MSSRLAGKTALITGTAGGQGRCAALTFAREGASIIGCDVKAEENAETVAMVRAEGGSMVSLEPLDLSSETEVQRLVRFAADQGGFDILYNNAAVARAATIEELTREQWDWNMANEVTLVYMTVRNALPVMKERGGGAIVNVGSIAGMPIGSGMPGNAPGNLVHCVAKAAIIRMTEALAIELAPYRIRVNSVSPGVIDTPQLRPFLGEATDAPVRRLFAAKCLVPRIGEVEDVVHAALYLASDEASYVTGVNLPVDGGFIVGGGVGLPTSEVAEAVLQATKEYE